MTWLLKNKVVVITGGAEGIGYTIADKYLQNGSKIVIILDINEALGTEAVTSLITKYGEDKAVFYKCDVTSDREEVSRNIFSMYSVDILVNCAGIANELLPRKTIDVNVTAVIEWSLMCWEHMRKDKQGNGGTIVIMSSVLGFRTDQYFPTYQASKRALIAFTKSLGDIVNYERSGVRVVAICPGPTETNFTSKVVIWDEDLSDQLTEHIPKIIWQTVDAVGEAAVEIYENSTSGTAWMIEGAQPIKEVIT